MRTEGSGDDRARETLLALAAALVLALPTVGLGFFLDDWYQLVVLENAPTDEAAANLFRFVDPERASVKVVGPWWAAPDLRIAFFRPLAGWLSVLDHALFGSWAPGWHAHAILWWLALVAVVAALVRRALPGTIGALAVLIFAIDDVGWLPVAWLANRNAVMAATFGLLGVWLHVRWREDGWTPGAPLSWASFALALGSGEGALGAFAYLVAWEAHRSVPIARRALGLVPAVVLIAIWATLREAAGAGAIGSGSYIDPTSDPIRWAWAAPGRAGALLACLLLTWPADLWLGAEDLRPVLILGGIGGAALWIWMLRIASEDWDEGEARALRWLGWGALGSLIPVLSTFPSNRLLLLPAVGGAALLAAILRHWWRVRWTERDPGHFHRLAAGMLALCGLVVAPLLWGVQTAVLGGIMRQGLDRAEQADLDGTSGARVMVVGAPDPVTALYLPAIRLLRGGEVPGEWRLVSFAPFPHRLVRTGEDRVEIEIVGGRMLETEFERLLRTADLPVRAGDRFDWAGIAVEVLEDDGIGPTRLAFTVPADPPVVWVGWVDGRMRRIALPPGGTAEVDGGPPPRLIRRD
jgi:hypothetical protein